MRRTFWATALSFVVLTSTAPSSRAEFCEAVETPQKQMKSRPPLTYLSATALSASPRSTPASAKQKEPRSLAEIEAHTVAVLRRLYSLKAVQYKNVILKAREIIEKNAPRSLEEAEFIHAIQFIGARGWALEWHGMLYETNDGGVTWAARPLPIPQATAAAQSAQGSPGGRATDKDALRGFQFITPRTAFVVGHSGVMATTDGGANWSQLGNPSRNPLLAISCLPDTSCWVGGSESATIFSRPAGSPVWTSHETPLFGRMLSIHFIDAQTGWAVGDRGSIITTTNGGAQWTLQEEYRTVPFWSAFFVDAKHGWAAGDNGVVLRTEDGGQKWTEGALDLPSYVARFQLSLRAVRFLDSKTGWAAGLNGAILGTTDGGRCWRLQHWGGDFAASQSMYALAVSEGPVVWAAGNSGNIIASRDKGRSWFPVRGAAADEIRLLGQLTKGQPR